MASRPLVTVQSPAKKSSGTVTLPFVLTAPIRSDVVQSVHTRMAKNHRQPYAVARNAGAQTSAQSWGTGRAVSRIPRVPGGGTHRSGQAAFGNMCRGGRMFAPNKIWRRWHRKISKDQRRFATVSALSASAVAPLVMARGHKVDHIPEIPLVLADADLSGIAKTKEAVALLKSVGAYDDIERVLSSRHIRAGKGKARGRRYQQKKGPLIIHDRNPEPGKRAPQLVQAFRNIPGVEFCHVTRLNLLQLAPGGTLGRFIIWTESAIKQLDGIFGTRTEDSKQKTGYRPPHSILTNPDISRIINSDEVQSALRAPGKKPRRSTLKKNPLKNLGALIKLNPYAFTQRRLAIAAAKKKTTPKVAKVAKAAAPKTTKPAAKKETPKGGVTKPDTKKTKSKHLRASKKFLDLLKSQAAAPLRSDDEKRLQL